MAVYRATKATHDAKGTNSSDDGDTADSGVGLYTITST